ncbi:unnamed protein product [Timema podura]|uniref:Uncharacterized protein n=1 Tax=Timema podura TaxID=61482 RepID=A0ABN7PQP3_TIMPD|nr:unnamed protein product [Timema podura]
MMIPQSRFEVSDHSFIFGSQSQFNFNFTGVRPKSPGKTPRSPKSPGGGLGLSEGEDSLNDEGVDDGEGEHIYFQVSLIGCGRYT